MPYFQPKEISVKCPVCGLEFTVPAFSIVDAEDMPAEVQALILGELNAYSCPRCGTSVRLENPLFFHDAKRQLAYVYIPPQVEISPQERQRIIGEMTRAIMARLPQEHPKAYLLQPREFLSLPNMLDAIMEALGVDKEILEERRRKSELIYQLLNVMDDSVAFHSLVGEHKDVLDEEFYALLRYARDAALSVGHKEEAERLEQLRQKLLPLTAWGRREKAYDDAVAFLKSEPTREELLDRVLSTSDDEELSALVTVLRPLFDYTFFRMLTERIEKAEKKKELEEAQRLRTLRQKLLELVEKVDQEAKEVLDKALNLLRDLLVAPDLDKAIEERKGEIDDVFLSFLSSEIKFAEEQGLSDVVKRLEEVWNAIVRHFRGDVPPEVAFIETLLVLDYPEETRAYLEKHRDELTPEVFKLMEFLIQDMEQKGVEEGAQRLRQLRAQALALVGRGP